MSAWRAPVTFPEHFGALGPVRRGIWKVSFGRRDVNEAEWLLAFNLPAAAVLVAGVVLEAILAGFREQGGSQDRQRMRKWSNLRNSAAHSPVPTVTLDQAREMVEDIRGSLTGEIKVGPPLSPPKAPDEAPPQVRGKYRFVPTSTAEFIRRKADELRLRSEERRVGKECRSRWS